MSDLNKVNKLNPFGKFCMTIGNLPASYMESLTYEEQLLWFCDFLKNTIIPTVNNNANAVEELQNLFIKLQDYVNNYFNNLDVQEEINNKLDAMAEDGTLETIIANYLKFDLQDLLNFRIFNNLDIDESELFNDYSHSQLQGFCKTSDNLIVFALINKEKQDNYVRLIEYNLLLNTIVRSSYLLLYHANSIAYDKTNNKLYISATSTSSEGITISNNDILVVDYETFSIIDTINISNLPSNNRIRSVSFDNDNNILYAGDTFTLFKLDLENSIITETISLDSANIDTLITNQTLKVYKKWIVGLFLNFIVFWDKTGNILRVINLEQYSQGEKDGEIEDFSINEKTGEIIIASYKKINTKTNYMNILFSISNIYTNSSNIPPYNLGGTDTTPITIYVDNTFIGQENGRSTNPFRSLQKAINVATNIGKLTRIYISGNEQDYVDIRGFNGILVFNSDITINGMDILYSKIRFDFNNYEIIINGLYSFLSSIYMNDDNNKSKIYKMNTSLNSNALNKCIYFQDVNAYLKGLSFIGDDTNNLIELRQHSNISIYDCDFSNYADKYAIYMVSSSECKLYSNTFNITNQAVFFVGFGSILYGQPTLTNKSLYNFDSRGKLKNVIVQDTSITNDIYYGEICEIDTNYDNMRIKIREGGVNAGYSYINCKNNYDDIVHSKSWANNNSFKTNILNIQKVQSTGKMTLNTHRYVAISNSDSTLTYEEITETPQSTLNYSCIVGIEYYN